MSSQADRTPNRLIHEKSPYLLQHAHNPVDWFPWGEEAFARARAEDKPVFLSIGYSTCHWCHVMERESFEDEETAALLNALYVPIKVDREERPDVDQVYMQAIQIMTGQGGWPLSAFLAADGRPFWGGTYFPPDDRYGRPGFRRILIALADTWRTRRAEILDSAAKLMAHVEEQSRAAHTAAKAPLGAATIQRGVEQSRARFDAVHGGFGPAPKFPRSHGLSFLLAAHARSGDPDTLGMVEVTLDRMARGGLQDHLGGGFHRYSTDERWLVPHFEKMLYDQALLARTYLEAHQVTGKEEYARVARRTLDYVLRDLTSPEGGFYAAEDADSEGEEGKFYVFTPEEIQTVLGREEGDFFGAVYGVTAQGNFEHGSSILHLPRPLSAVAAAQGSTEAALAARLDRARGALLATRNQRIRPHRDDKILTDWNGLMIGTMAAAGRILGVPEYMSAAERAAAFIATKLRRADGRLLRRYRDGEAAIPAYLDDHAFLAHGLLELYAATFDPLHLEQARALARDMLRLFHDEKDGGLFFSASDGESLLVRTKEVYDGAVPSGNAIAALVLLRLGALLADPELAAAGRDIVNAFAGVLEASPLAFPQMLIALDFAHGPGAEVVLAGKPEHPAIMAFRAALDRRFLPHVVAALHPGGAAGARLAELAPFLAAHAPAGEGGLAYVCRDHACRLPTSDAAVMLAELEAVAAARR